MNEISRILEPKEKVIYDGKPVYAPYIIGTLLVTIIAVVLVGLFLGVYIHRVTLAIVAGALVLVIGLILSNVAYSKLYYAITPKRAIIQSGIIGVDFKSIDFDKMQNVSVDVGILGAIFKVGTVKIFTGEVESVGGGKNSAPTIQPKYDEFNYINSPYEVLKKLQTELSKRKEKLR